MKKYKLSLNRLNILFIFVGLVFCSCSSQKTLEHIRILNWNDFHSSNISREMKDDQGTFLSGGAAIMKGALEQFRNDSIPVITVHAGDEFQGSPISGITRGASQIRILNLLKPDVFTIGNHEFDYGSYRLDSLLSGVSFPVISANLVNTDKNELFTKPYKILNVGHVKIGFIGLMFPALSSVVLGENIKNIQVLDYKKTVQKYISVLKGSVDLMVVVSHMGIEYDRSLAQANNEIDIIFGGHSHTKHEKPENVNGVLIFHAGSYGRYLGKLDLWVDTKLDTILKYDGKLLSVNSRNFSSDKKVQAVVDSLENIVGKDLDQVIAELKTDWFRDRNKESKIGNWIADAFRDFSGADIAFQNSGGIRKNLKTGPITKRDFWEVAPFGNYLVEFSASGEEIYKIVEQKFRNGIIHVSGLNVVYNPKASDKKVIKKLLINGKPVQYDKTYSVATLNFVFDQFQKDFNFLQKREVKRFNKLDRDVLIEAAEKQKVLHAKIEGRLQKVSN
jgi:5'-nucleotidase / UDP-sugar diphosphatase